MTDRWVQTILTDLDTETAVAMQTGDFEERARCLFRWTVLEEAVTARRAHVLAIFAPALRNSAAGVQA